MISHTENRFDRVAAGNVKVGPVPAPPLPVGRSKSTASLERGRIDELEGRRQTAMARYQAAITSHPDNLSLLKAAGRLAVTLGWADSRSAASTQTIEWLQRAHARNTTDFEVQYDLGVGVGERRPVR